MRSGPHRDEQPGKPPTVVAVVAVVAAGLPGLAAANPSLVKGTWPEITPPGVTTGEPETACDVGTTGGPAGGALFIGALLLGRRRKTMSGKGRAR